MRLFNKSEAKSAVEIVPHLLIVEDDEMQALFLQHILEKHNYAVVYAANGREALEKMAQNRPLMVLSDITMPEMDGYSLCLAVKEDEALQTIPVLLLTSLSDINDAVKGLYCGADGLIAKPYNEEFLLSRIDDALSAAAATAKAKTDEEEAYKRALAGEEPATRNAPRGIRVAVGGRSVLVTPERLQNVGLLASSYQIAVQKNREMNALRAQADDLERQLKATHFENIDLRRQLNLQETNTPSSGDETV